MVALLTRVMVFFGLGIVTTTALIALFGTLVAALQAEWSGLPAASLAYMALAGVPEALGIIVGAKVTALSLQAVRSMRFLGGS